MVSVGVLLVFALVAGAVVVSALQADGRPASRAETNDGGAWLVKRDLGYVGHVNRVVGEVTKAVQVGDPQAELDVDQGAGVIVAHDATGQKVSVIDDASGSVVNEIEVPEGARVWAVDGGAVVYTPASLNVWLLDERELGALSSLEGDEPVISGDGAGVVRVLGDVVVAADQERVWRLSASGDEARAPVEHGREDPIADLTFVGTEAQRVVLVDEDGDGTLINGGNVGSLDLSKDGVAPALSQPRADGDFIEFVSAGGMLHRVDLDSDARPEPLVDLEGTGPLSPIVYGGCSFTVVTEPAKFQKICGGEVSIPEPLRGTASSLRLKLVNGWVWINDLDSGAAWVTDPQRPVTLVADWDAVLTDRDQVNEDLETESGEEVYTDAEDPEEAQIRAADELEDWQAQNRDPIAEDDEAGTRADREVLVDVLGNDEDPDGDALRVSRVSDAEEGHVVESAADGGGVVFAPAPGFTGTTTFRYTIDDGRGGTDSATVTMKVVGPEVNGQPQAEVDVVATSPGQPATVNVLDNDTDPDGDALWLRGVSVTTDVPEVGELVWEHSGLLIYTPDPQIDVSQVDLEYQMVDEFGEVADGRVLVNVRLEDTNSPPDARHDTAVTVVGRSVTVEALENDYDSDGDPLIAQALELRQPAGQPVSELDVTLTADGEFSFTPSSEGTFVFSYQASDGDQSDEAFVRIDVSEPTENRAPVAVRDDVVIARGGQRMAYVLDNDVDPDGDVVGLVDQDQVDGLRIQEVAGAGYLLEVEPDAPSQMSFTYTISDGFEEASAPVVVTVAEGGDADQPPVAVDDVVDVRPGQMVLAQVLENDFDPKGGTVSVLNVSSDADAGFTAVPSDDGKAVEVIADESVTDGTELTYDIVDEAGNPASARLRVRVVPDDQENRPPIARRDEASTPSDRSVVVPVLANDSDRDGDLLNVESIAEQPTAGEAVVTEEQTIEYRPSEGFVGTDRLVYTVVDMFGARSTGEMLVGVMPPVDNRAPHAYDDEFDVAIRTDPVTLDVTANDIDPDGDPLAVSEVTQTNLGEVEVVDGEVVYRPPEVLDEAAQTSFTYQVSDGAGGTDEATVVLEVKLTADARAPVAGTVRAGPIAEGGQDTVNVLDAVSDPDTPISELEVSVDDPALDVGDDGEVTVTAGGTVSRHTYTVTDPDGLSDEGFIIVMVVDNQAPVFEPMEFETEAGEPVDLDLARYVTDPDGDPLFFGCCDDVRGGGTSEAQKDRNRLSLRFTPDDGFVGEAGFTITADDQVGRPVSGRVIIRVQTDNRPPQAIGTTVGVPFGESTTVDLNRLVRDPDGDDRHTFEIDGPTDGDVDVDLDGGRLTITATGDPGQDDLVNFTVTDQGDETAEGTITIEITPAQGPPPQAVADRAEASDGGPISIDVLANDSDPLGGGLEIASVGGTDGGSTQISNGGVTFTPADGYSGTTSFTYTIGDTGGREATGQVTVEVIGRPAAPSRPDAQAAAGTVTLTWRTPSANGAQITGYEVRINGAETRQVAVRNSTTLSDLTNGQAYRFEVRAISQAGEGAWSPASNEVTPDVRPGRPAAPTVTFRDQALQISWNAPNNEGSPIENYDVRISGADIAVRTVPLGNRTSYLWEGLVNGRDYTFAVRAKNQHDEPGDWSPESAPEHPSREPGSPGAPTVERGDGSLRVCWTAPPNGGDPIGRYELRMRSGGSAPVGSNTCYTWHNLPNGESQQFQVRARNRAGWGAWSPNWSQPVKPCGIPEAPTAPGAQRGDKAATVTWQAPNAQGCAITSYEVQTDGEITNRGIQPAARQHNFERLTNGTTYRFRVRAVNEEGGGAWSNLSDPVTPAGRPFAPRNLRATPDVGKVTLNWDAADPNGAPVRNYRLWVNGNPRDVGNVTGYAITGLAPNTTYRFRVAAENNVGVGAESNEASATTPGPPAQVRNLNSSNNQTTIDVSWSAPSSDGGKPVQHYRITGVPGGTATAAGTSYRFTGNAGTSYSITVQACNVVDCGPGTTTRASATNPQLSAYKGAYCDNAAGPYCENPPSDGCHGGCWFIILDMKGYSPNTQYGIDCWCPTNDYDYSDGNWAWKTVMHVETNGSGAFNGRGPAANRYWGPKAKFRAGGVETGVAW